MRRTRLQRHSLLGYLPALTLAAFLAPVLAGLVGTWLPAFGYFPALGGTGFTLAPWAELFAQPGLGESLRLTLLSGILATAAAFFLTIFFLAACHGGRLILAVRGLMAPLIAVPHAAVALGLAFLIAPSGWLVRLVSPWATGWELPPDVATVQDPNALALTLALVVKEVPFLLLMTLAALEQVRAEPDLVAPTWTAWCLEPREVEFWGSGAGTGQTRVRYRRAADAGAPGAGAGSAQGGWQRALLWP